MSQGLTDVQNCRDSKYLHLSGLLVWENLQITVQENGRVNECLVQCKFRIQPTAVRQSSSQHMGDDCRNGGGAQTERASHSAKPGLDQSQEGQV